MSRKRTYDEASVVRAIEKKASVRIVRNGMNKFIEVVKNATDVGAGTWGKIDYLVKVHGYFQHFVNKIDKRLIPSKGKKDSEESFGSNKTAKREQKLNMAKMSKDAMKKVARKK